MLSRISNQLSSIKVKLFIWFWLIIVTTIAVHRFVTSQMNIDHIPVPVDRVDLHRLTMFQQWLEKAKPQSIQEATEKLNSRRKMSVHSKHLVFKNITTNDITLSSHRRKTKLINFLKVTKLDNIETWQFINFRLTGPVNVTIGKQTYQLLYLRKSGPPKHFGMFVMQLPLWIRLGIPVIISTLFCWLLARSLSRPISNISKVAQQLGDGQLSARVEGDTLRRDELGIFARNFNAMADKIENNSTAQQRLLGDVSHELRSPLTRLQMALALVQQRGGKEAMESGEIEGYFQRCELEVQRLDNMIGNVLTLSKYENSIVKLDEQKVNITDLINTLIDDANFVAASNGVNVELSGNIPHEVLADPQLLSSALSNVINNAAKYSPKESTVNIALVLEEQQLVILVADQGPGVPINNLPHLFEPFYRVATARDRLSGGTGLGLAIAKHAIEAHNGTITASNINPNGLEVTINLPLKFS